MSSGLGKYFFFFFFPGGLGQGRSGSVTEGEPAEDVEGVGDRAQASEGGRPLSLAGTIVSACFFGEAGTPYFA